MDLSKAVGFFDTRCSKCGARIGWHGKLADRPPCRKCSHIETVDLSAEEKALLDGDCYCMIQDLLYEHKSELSESEKTFLINMYKKHQAKEPYNDTQISSIKRIHTRIVKSGSPQSSTINKLNPEGSKVPPKNNRK